MSLAARKIRLIMSLRQSGISDLAVLSAIERTPREAFVSATFQDQAYEARALPIGCGQTLSQPQVVASMTQALKLSSRQKVLEIGTGSGYQTAVLGRLARRVYTIERHRELLKEAERRFTELRIHNVTAKVGDGSLGWKEQAPFERILITAAAHDMPPALYDQLALGGLMVLPVGPEHGEQELCRITRTDDGPDWERLGAVRFVPLVGGLPGDAPDITLDDDSSLSGGWSAA